MDWKDIHDSSMVVDLHSHPALKSGLFKRDLAASATKIGPIAKLFKNHFWPPSVRSSFEQAQQGGVDVQLSTAYVPEEQWFNDIGLLKWARFFLPGLKQYTKPSYYDITISQIKDIENQVDRFNSSRISYGKNNRPKRIEIVRSADQLKKLVSDKDDRMMLIHSVEGAHSLQGESWGKIVDHTKKPTTVMQGEVFMNLEDLHKKGVAYLTLAHFYPNCATKSCCFPYPEYGLKFLNKKGLYDKWDHTQGLTKLGKEIVEKMLELGMLIDITHLTPVARAELYEIIDSHKAKSSVICSHAGCYSINPDPYCLEDWEIKWIADNGGAIGVIFMNYWLSQSDTKLGMKYIIQTIKHMIDVGGIDAVAIGSDFDGFTDPPDEMVDYTQMPRLTRELCAMSGGKYNEDQVQKMIGGNALRVLLDGWK